MSFWDRIGTLLEEARRRTLGAMLETIANQRQRRSEAAFSIALIALSAKMAKADGIVTDDEIAAFLHFFTFPPEEGDKVKMIFQLAQKDVAGYDEYVGQVRRIFDDAPAVLEDVLDCLFYVAAADGVAHPKELELLDKTAAAFGIPDHAYRRMRAAHLGPGEDDPWLILGLDHDADVGTIKKTYYALVRDHHPDALIARGVPTDLIKIAEGRMATINNAYERVLREAETGGSPG